VENEFRSAITLGDKSRVEKLLIMQPGLANVSFEDGKLTPLELALEFGSMDIAQILLEKGADIDGKNDNGSTPLISSAINGCKQAVAFLLKHGADIKICNNDRLNAITGAYFEKQVEIVTLLKSKGALFGEMYFDTFGESLDWGFEHKPDDVSIRRSQDGKGYITVKKEDLPEIRSYTDKWGGKNYGCYPITTEGQSLKESLDASEEWLLVTSEEYVDERNDNQRDIHRGSTLIYKKKTEDKIVNVSMSKSRSGKTVDWTFKIYKNASSNKFLKAEQ
jgi:hypothetical protein